MRHLVQSSASWAIVVLAALCCGSAAAAAEADATYPWPEALFSDPIEVGDLDIWRRVEITGGGKVELSTGVRYNGRYAVLCTAPDSGAEPRQARVLGQYTGHPRFAEAKSFCLRAHLQFGKDFKAGSGCSVMALGSFKAPPDGSYEGHMIEVAVKQRGNGVVLCLPSSAKKEEGNTVLKPKAWHCVELHVVPGAEGKADVAVMLDGKKELAVSGVALPRRPDGLAVGLLQCAGSAGGSLLVDEVEVTDAPTGPREAAVRLAHPSFVPRIGAPVVALLTGDRENDRLVATLTSKAGLDRKVFEGKGPFEGRVDFRVDLAGLPASQYTLTVTLQDASGKARAAAQYSYAKPYDGDTEYSIDASNAITYQGRKFFPVTSFGLKRTEIAKWKQERYCNILYGKEWGTELVGVPKYKRLLDVAAEQGMTVIGPAADDRFDRQGLPQWDPKAMEEYLKEFVNHPGVAWWMWREEPINWKYDAATVKSWYDLVKRLDPKRMHENLEMGGCYQIGILRAKVVYNTWPYLVGDSYSWDIYPIENEHEKNGTFVDYAQVADRVVNWNMGLVPVIVNVAPADCTPGKKGGTPTPAEVEFVCWLSIVHQAKGVHWYPYQGKVPPENFVAMTKFVDDTTALTEAILGEESPVPVTDKEQGGGRVDVRATTDGQGNVYIFAVNLGREGEKVTFTLGRRIDGKALPEGLQVEVYGQDRTIALQGATFTDEFEPIGVRIYKLAGAAK